MIKFSFSLSYRSFPMWATTKSTKLPVMLMVALKAGASSPDRKKNKWQKNYNSFATSNLPHKLRGFQRQNIIMYNKSS